MVGTSAVLQDQYSDQYIIPQPQLVLAERKDEVLELTDLQLSVTDSETGRPISNAMVSVDKHGRTAVCDERGQAIIPDIVASDFTVDVIVAGYIANTTMLHFPGGPSQVLHIKMVRNC
jgi:hypothetical protein